MKVTISANDLTIDDYIRSGCNEALAASPSKWNIDYLTALYSRIEEALAASDESSVQVLRILQAVMASRAPWIHQPSKVDEHPDLPVFELDESALEYIRKILLHIDDHEVRARAADNVYQHSIANESKRDFTAAEIAVLGYLSEAVRWEASDGSWPEAHKRIERAFSISTELNKKELRLQVVAHIERAITNHIIPFFSEDKCESAIGNSGEYPSLYPAQLMNLLLKYKEGDPKYYCALAERLAHEALTAKEWTMKWQMNRNYWRIASDWYRLSGDQLGELGSLEQEAESWIEEGRQIVERPEAQPYDFSIAEHRLWKGIEVLREVKGRAKTFNLPSEVSRIQRHMDEVRIRHLKYQERGVEALPLYQDSTEFDASKIYEMVEGMGKLEALFVMTQVSLPKRSDVEEKVSEDLEKFHFTKLFSLVQIEERGRVTARTDTGTTEGDFWARTCQEAVSMYDFRAQLHVWPQQWKIMQDHPIDLSDFVWIAHKSPFVPAGREMLFARGLFAGMQCNLTLSLHLLIPQVEQAVRVIIRKAIITDEELCETHKEVLDEPDQPFLGQALCERWCVDILARTFGEEGDAIVFALRVLLVERFGGNIRNRILHGLTSYGGAQGWLCSYFWWLVLKMCCTTTVISMKMEES